LTALPLGDEALLALSAWSAHARPWTLVLANLDWFKAFNDLFGYLEGDRAIARVAEVVRGCADGPHCYRTGGDELLVLSLRERDLELGVRLHAGVRALGIPLEHAEVPRAGPLLAVSVAVLYVPALVGPIDLLALARERMHELKGGGRGCVLAWPVDQ